MSTIYPFSANPFVPDLKGHRAGRTGHPVISVRWAEQPTPQQPNNTHILMTVMKLGAFGVAGILALRVLSPTSYAKLAQGFKDNLPALASQTEKVKEYATTVGTKIQNNNTFKSAMETVKPAYTSVKNSLSQFFKSILSK